MPWTAAGHIVAAGGVRAASGDPAVSLTEVLWTDPAARDLRAAQQVELSARYGEGTPEPHADDVTVTVLLAVDGAPVGCGSLRDVSAEQGGSTAEVKRVYVAPAWRGRGLSRLLMRDLESRATIRGMTRLVLEAGLQQPEAIGLYLSIGYLPVPNYGEWAGVADSRCFAKDTGPRTADPSRPCGTPPTALGPPDVTPGAVPGLRIETVPYADPEAAALRQHLDDGGPPADPEVTAALAAPGGYAAVDAALGSQMLVTVLARHHGRPVGCASLGRPRGLAEHDPVTGGDPGTTGELRLVCVRPAAHRSGVAGALVRAIERHAADAGLRAVVAETSIRQPGVLALYRALGYRPVFPFGAWEGDPLGLYLGRALVPAAG